MPATRATSRRRFWSKRRRPISRCSTAPPARRRAAAPARYCRSGRIISMPASIRIFRSAAYSALARDCTTLDLGVDAYYKIAQRPARQRHFRPGPGAQRLQLCQGHQRRHRIQRQIQSGNFQAYGNLAIGQEKATQVVSNQYLFDNVDAACRPRRLDRIAIHRHALDLHRSQPVRDRLGGPVLSMERHDASRPT